MRAGPFAEESGDRAQDRFLICVRNCKGVEKSVLNLYMDVVQKCFV